MTRKKYQDLTFVDEFMFAKVMQNKRLCKKLLEIILGIKIKDIKYLEQQKTLKDTYDGKGIRLDVYVDDGENTVYDIEMQTTNPRNIPKRMRYYQGMIDKNPTSHWEMKPTRSYSTLRPASCIAPNIQNLRSSSSTLRQEMLQISSLKRSKKK